LAAAASAAAASGAAASAAAASAPAELAGTWKYTAPPNPNAKGNRPPAETVYVIKVDGNRFTGTMLVNRGIADILNGAIDGTQITFERLDGNGRKTPFKGEISGDRLTVSLANPPASGGSGRGPQGPIVLKKVGALAGLPSGQVEALLIHELAHIRRHDYLVNILQSIAEALLFYHPAVWWVSGHIRTERELYCDDVAVSLSGDAFAYALALAEMESARPAHLNAAIAANGGSLADRIGRLLGQSRPVSRTLPGPAVHVSAILLVIAAYGMFAQSADSPRFEVASIKRGEAWTMEVPMGVKAGTGLTMQGLNLTMAKFTGFLGTIIGREVIDRTGFTGKFDLHLEFASDDAIAGLPISRRPSDSDQPPDPAARPTIFTALQEQLGLKLESTKGPVEVIVIDRVERPTEN
jgi:hypothetical protein